MSRNRSTGWQHAKQSGHVNEAEIEYIINSDKDNLNSLCSRILNTDNLCGYAETEGKNQTNVANVLGNTTKSKVDMKIFLKNHNTINLSIKKSLGGQVYLIKTSRFVQGFEKHFNTTIPNDVVFAMQLFWGEYENIDNIIKKHGEKNNIRIKDYEHRKKRLVASSLYIYNKDIANSLINWFKENIENITLYCFSYGLASDPSDWADYIWYKNLVDDKNYDYIFKIDDISKSSGQNTHLIKFGTVNGGTTIQLPFGFVQWHQDKMQFHHKYEKIEKICRPL